MSGKQILSLVLAIVVGIIAFSVVKVVFTLVFSVVWWVIGLAVMGGIVYALYRGFNNMLASGKRLT